MFQEYIKSVLTVSICAFLCNFSLVGLCKSVGLSKGLKLLTNLCVLSVVLLPLISAFTSLKSHGFDIKDTQMQSEDSISFEELTEKEISKALADEIKKRTGLTVLDIGIDISYENDTVNIDEISVIVSSENEETQILSVLKELFGNETDFIIRMVEFEGVNEID